MSYTKQQVAALTEMQNQNVHFTRTSDNKIVVFMSSDGNGSHIANQDILKTYLEANGFFEFDRGFDPVCGKGTQTFKAKKRK